MKHMTRHLLLLLLGLGIALASPAQELRLGLGMAPTFRLTPEEAGIEAEASHAFPNSLYVEFAQQQNATLHWLWHLNVQEPLQRLDETDNEQQAALLRRASAMVGGEWQWFRLAGVRVYSQALAGISAARAETDADNVQQRGELLGLSSQVWIKPLGLSVGQGWTANASLGLGDLGSISLALGRRF